LEIINTFLSKILCGGNAADVFAKLEKSLGSSACGKIWKKVLSLVSNFYCSLTVSEGRFLVPVQVSSVFRDFSLLFTAESLGIVSSMRLGTPLRSLSLNLIIS
jgi:hypothetical protein